MLAQVAESVHSTLYHKYQRSINFIKPTCYNIQNSRRDKWVLSSFIMQVGEKDGTILTDDLRKAQEKIFWRWNLFVNISKRKKEIYQRSHWTLERMDTRYTNGIYWLESNTHNVCVTMAITNQNVKMYIPCEHPRRKIVVIIWRWGEINFLLL